MKKHLNEGQMKEKTRQLRINILEMLNEAGSGHSGGSLSAIDIIGVLYNNVMQHDAKNPHWKERDRFILSKGHICPALYAVLADCEYFDVEELKRLRKYGSNLQGHPCMEKTPGVEVSAGSLGQGLSIATGIALGARLSNE
ncbi:MAG: transketolase, partial [Ruminiclostridium sp.]